MSKGRGKTVLSVVLVHSLQIELNPLNRIKELLRLHMQHPRDRRLDLYPRLMRVFQAGSRSHTLFDTPTSSAHTETAAATSTSPPDPHGR